MIRYFIKLAYNGSNYHGWQMQENAHSVQAEINEKLSLIIGEPVNVVGCGRTDSGVHAREFFAHFDTNKLAFELSDFVYKLNRFLPSDIVVFNVFQVDQNLHARFSAKSRTYRYYINQMKDPFKDGLSYYYHGPLDAHKMNVAANYLLDYNDFTSFSKLHTQTNTNLCNVTEANWEVEDGNYIFTISADRFLRNMVRAIAGTMVEIGKGKIKPEEMKRIIEAKDRSEAGFSVPAHGLFLEKVSYESLLVE
jgi:tRNA pseudouridine38-40 synthase